VILGRIANFESCSRCGICTYICFVFCLDTTVVAEVRSATLISRSVWLARIVPRHDQSCHRGSGLQIGFSGRLSSDGFQRVF
jgi:formate hydrogenlyase subunit 6/NADH:ubiquinone oxidoreductase subunit I